MGKWRLTPLASYYVTARVLATETYNSYPLDAIAPKDLLLAWGPMSDSSHLNGLEFRIYNRYATWHWSGSPPLPKREMERHMANTHVIPASEDVRSALRSARVGSIVTLRGDLIQLDGPEGPIRSSLERTDTGPGACELVYVTSMWVR